MLFQGGAAAKRAAGSAATPRVPSFTPLLAVDELIFFLFFYFVLKSLSPNFIIIFILQFFSKNLFPKLAHKFLASKLLVLQKLFLKSLSPKFNFKFSILKFCS